MKLPSSGFRIFSQTLEGNEPYQLWRFSSTNSSSRIVLLIFLQKEKYNLRSPLNLSLSQQENTQTLGAARFKLEQQDRDERQNQHAQIYTPANYPHISAHA